MDVDGILSILSAIDPGGYSEALRHTIIMSAPRTTANGTLHMTKCIQLCVFPQHLCSVAANNPWLQSLLREETELLINQQSIMFPAFRPGVPAREGAGHE